MAGSQYPQTTNRATTYLSYYNCFCSVDKNHHLHRRWINPFPQLLASHDLKTKLDVINSIQDISRKLKTIKCSSSSPFETPPDSGIRGNNVLSCFRKVGQAVPTPLLFLGIRFVTIVAAQSLQLGMVVGHDNLFIVRISRMTLLCLILMFFSSRILLFLGVRRSRW